MSERLWVPEELEEEEVGSVPRLAQAPVWDALTVMPIVVLTGPRQTGRTALVRTFPPLRGHQYVSLDELPILAQAREAPADLVHRAPRLVIDDLLRHDALAAAVRDAVDEQPRRRAGHFVLTTSADPQALRRVREALAGRAAYVPLWPLTRRERRGLGTAGLWSELWSTPVPQWYDLLLRLEPLRDEWRPLAWQGGYPAPALQLRSARQRETWFAGYVDGFLTHEVERLAAIEHRGDFRRLMRVAARRLGQVMNKSEMAREAGITQPTAHRYLRLLEASYQLVALEAFTLSSSRNLVKSPKAYWSDTGLALFLAEEAEPRRAHLENLVLGDLLAWKDAQPRRPRVMHWRTRLGEEVDFVVERGEELLAVDVTDSLRPQPADARGLRAFRDEYGGRVRGGLLLHAGEEAFWISQDVLAVPWWRVL